MRLVADIGGTNSRLALCAKGVIIPTSIQRFLNSEWDCLNDILHVYCHAHPDAVINDMVIAVAGPVHAGSAILTNRNWTIISDRVAQLFACNRVILLNDLAALGYAVPFLGTDKITKICGQDVPRGPNGQALVVGIGTGFNISQVITKDQCTVCPPAEAGHISMPSAISSELEDRACNPEQFPSVETLFSGRGLTAFCRKFTNLEWVTGEAAIKSYGDPEESTVTSAIDTYAGLLGLLLRDFSLSYMPSHGMFLAGSVGRSIASCAPDSLIKVLQEPCNFRLQRNPSVFVAQEDDAALLGCAQF